MGKEETSKNSIEQLDILLEKNGIRYDFISLQMPQRGNELNVKYENTEVFNRRG